MNYSNPKRQLTVENWPGGMERVTAIFTVEALQHRQAERVSRITRSPSGKESRPKLTTYALKVAIVSGDDGKTYIAQLQSTGCISIMQGNLKFEQETIWPKDERFERVFALFAQTV